MVVGFAGHRRRGAFPRHAGRASLRLVFAHPCAQTLSGTPLDVGARRNRWIMAVAFFAVASAAAAQPDLEGFWTPRIERARSGQVLIDELPKGVVLINDTGAGELAAGDFAGLKLTPRAIEEVGNYDFKAELKRENTCNAPTAAFFMQAPFPMEIYQADQLVVFKMEYFDLVRVVHLDGRAHPPATAP